VWSARGSGVGTGDLERGGAHGSTTVDIRPGNGWGRLWSVSGGPDQTWVEAVVGIEDWLK